MDVNEIKFFVKIQKTNFGGGGVRGGSGKGGSGWWGGGGQGGCERRISFCENSKKKIFFGGGRGGGGSGWWGGWARVDVNAMLGVGGDVVYGGCEPRVEGIVQGT